MSWEKIQDMHLTEEENEKFYATESKNRIKFYVFLSMKICQTRCHG